jgi:hypothetical protein
MSTTKPSYPEFDQIVKGNVSIKKLSKYRYRITFSKIGKFLVYQVWDKDNAMNLNSNRSVFYLSAKEWVKNFNNMNRDLKQKKKPLFTPTTIMETECDRNFAFVIHKAYLNKSGHIVFTVSTKEIKVENNNISSKKLIKIPRGKFNNMRFDIDAASNGDGIVFNKSNCGYPKVRVYDPKQNKNPSFCSDNISNSIVGLSSSDLNTIWYGKPPNGDNNTIEDSHYWTPAEICKVNPNSSMCYFVPNPKYRPSFSVEY